MYKKALYLPYGHAEGCHFETCSKDEVQGQIQPVLDELHKLRLNAGGDERDYTNHILAKVASAVADKEEDATVFKIPDADKSSLSKLYRHIRAGSQVIHR